MIISKTVIISVGSSLEPHWRAACDEYKKRISAYSDVVEVAVKDSKIPKSPSESDIKIALGAEGRDILSKIPKKAFVVALCVEGKELSSEELAGKIGSAALCGKDCLCFIIGSSHGLCDEVKRAADLKLSMSRLTFPHRLARVMLYESIYRSFSIISGAKYHK